MKLSDNVKFIKGVGETRAELFGKLGIITVRDLLEFYPRTYEDRTKTVSIAQAVPGENAAIIATVVNTVKKSEIRNGLTVFKCDVRDDENIMTVTIFNNRFAAAKLKEGEEYLFYGKVNNSAYRREMVNPQIDNAA